MKTYSPQGFYGTGYQYKCAAQFCWIVVRSWRCMRYITPGARDVLFRFRISGTARRKWLHRWCCCWFCSIVRFGGVLLRIIMNDSGTRPGLPGTMVKVLVQCRKSIVFIKGLPASCPGSREYHSLHPCKRRQAGRETTAQDNPFTTTV